MVLCALKDKDLNVCLFHIVFPLYNTAFIFIHRIII